jgi:hypothetical protein
MKEREWFGLRLILQLDVQLELFDIMTDEARHI